MKDSAASKNSKKRPARERLETAGYSGTPLVRKLGIKANCALALLGAPDDFWSTLGSLPEGVKVVRSLRGKADFDVIVFFCTSSTELNAAIDRLKSRLSPAGGLWLAWPKKASGVASDLSGDVVRNSALQTGLVDNKICAIDETWSGLRCVFRLVDRPRRNGRDE